MQCAPCQIVTMEWRLLRFVQHYIKLQVLGDQGIMFMELGTFFVC